MPIASLPLFYYLFFGAREAHKGQLKAKKMGVLFCLERSRWSCSRISIIGIQVTQNWAHPGFFSVEDFSFFSLSSYSFSSVFLLFLGSTKKKRSRGELNLFLIETQKNYLTESDVSFSFFVICCFLFFFDFLFLARQYGGPMGPMRVAERSVGPLFFC